MPTTTHDLKLTFATDAMNVLTISIPRANPDLTDTEVADAMQKLIDCGSVYSMSKGAPQVMNGAKLITTDKTEFEVTS
jgi:hypothetical protein